MKRLNRTLAGACALAFVAGPSSAQMNHGDLGIYTGQPVKDLGISLRSWGSGAAVEASDQSFAGPNAIKVTTHGRFQGARLVLDKPVDLKTAIGDPNAYLQFTYQVKDRSATGGGGFGDYGSMYGRGSSGGGKGPGAGLGGGGNNPGDPGGRGGGGRYGQYGGGAGGGAEVKLGKPKEIASLRVVLVTTDGKKLDTSMALENSRAQRESWRSLAVPVGALPGIKDTSAQLKEIQFFGDSPGVIYLGEIRVLVDETPIRVDDLDERTIAKNDTLPLVASAEAGPSPLKYEWTIQGVPSKEPGAGSEVTTAYLVTAEGRSFKHQFRKSGDYKLTLTVSDLNGLKKPVTKTTTIHVTL